MGGPHPLPLPRGGRGDNAVADGATPFQITQSAATHLPVGSGSPSPMGEGGQGMRSESSG